jgi:hypothetical protein
MGSGESSGIGKKVQQAASEAFAKTSDMAQDAAEKAKQAASETASSITHQVKELLDRQVGSGAEMVGHFANSAKRAAEDLDQNAPQLAGLVHGFADRIETYAGDLRQKSAEQLVRAVSDATRRQPALVFGLAAVAGFFAFRTLKSTPSVASPSIQPTHESNRSRAGEYHGI